MTNNNRKIHSKWMGSVLTMGLVVSFQNCGAGFSSGLGDAKLLTLQSTSIFTTSANQIIIRDGKCYVSTPTGAEIEVPCPPTPTPTPPGATPTPPGATPTPPGATPTPPGATPTPPGATPTPPGATPTPPGATPTPPGATPTPPGATPTPPGATPTPPGPTPPPEIPENPMPMPHYCGSNYTHMAGFNLKSTSENLKLVLLPNQPFAEYATGLVPSPPNLPHRDSILSAVEPVCTIVDGNMKTELLQKQFTFPKAKMRIACPNLANGTYTLSIVRESTTRNFQRGILHAASGSWGITKEPFFEAANPPDELVAWYDMWHAANRVVADVTRNTNGTFSVAVRAESAQGWGPAVLADRAAPHGGQNCDYSYSPLMVQMGRARSLDLTAPKDGVYFDIAGFLAEPVAHTKKLISWFKREASPNQYFIVLPNERGEVNGIEQLFGNNTSGPDGTYAADGYEALRKFDGRMSNGNMNARARDGYITAKDDVFTKLRFWLDENVDGIAQPHELKTLESLGVESIDLKADPNFKEVDRYGNKITLKSVVKTTDGKLHVMYDLWFK